MYKLNDLLVIKKWIEDRYKYIVVVNSYLWGDYRTSNWTDILWWIKASKKSIWL